MNNFPPAQEVSAYCEADLMNQTAFLSDNLSFRNRLDSLAVAGSLDGLVLTGWAGRAFAHV